MKLDKIELELIKGNKVEFIYNDKTYEIYQGEICENDDVFILLGDGKTDEKYFFKDLLKVKRNGTDLKEMLNKCEKIKIK